MSSYEITDEVEKPQTQPSRVVWIRVGALGDLIVSLQALESSIKRFPEARVWILGSKLWTEILVPSQWPQIDGILVSEDGKFGSFFVPQGDNWILETSDMPASDLYRQTDVTVNLRIESYRFSWGPWRSMVPIRIGSCPPKMKWLYTHHFRWLGKEPAIHERDWYDAVARAGSGPEPKLGELIKSSLPNLVDSDPLKSKMLFGLEHKQYVIVNPTASRKEKAWPRAKFKELVAQLSKTEKVVVVGAPNETEWLKEVAQDTRIIQPTSLRDLFYLVSSAKLLVCNTSSMQFVAAAQKTPAVVLMGLAPPLRWGPLGPKDIAVKANATFNPKEDLFAQEQKAYESIGLDEVKASIQKLLTSVPNGDQAAGAI